MIKSILMTSLLISQVGTKSIYGTDNRQEASAYPNAEVRALSQSVAAQISNDLIAPYDGEHNELKNQTLAEDMKVCKDERFSEQNDVSHCTAFLVSPDTVLTASHCVIKQDACKNHKWVFSYTNESNIISNKDVFTCAEIKKLNVGMDYALVRLDRKVEGRSALKLAHHFLWKRKANYVVIGHPSGLPLKIADNVNEVPVFDTELYKSTNYFGLNSDTFGGSSGSPVIDIDTHEVAGILISGSADYKFDGSSGCFRTLKYNQNGRDGSEVAVKTNSIKIK